MKKKLFVTGLMILIILSLCSCTSKMSKNEEYDLLQSKEIKVNTIRATFVYDATDLKEVIGYADNVFVGKIQDYIKTNNTSTSGIPQTSYKVEVLENIKGKLKTNIEIIKGGGLDKDRKSKSIYENDILPIKDKEYIFIVFALENGEMKAEGMNTTILLNSADGYQSSEKYNKVISAYENEKLFNRIRYESKYKS